MNFRYLTQSVADDALASKKMAFVSGPRQVGKTTLGKELLRDLRSGGAEAIYQRILEQIGAGGLHVITFTAAVAERATEVIRSCYRARKPVAIRSLDALQLGCALAGGASEIVSADTRMRASAQIFHLPVFPSRIS